MTKLDKALEWAKNYTAGGHCPGIDGPWAAAEVIKSLPDHWVDVKKVREIIEEMNGSLSELSESDFSNGFEATSTWRDALEALIAPKTLTLYELIEQGHEPEEYKFMQCSVSPWGDAVGIIFQPGKERSSVILPAGGFSTLYNYEITPLLNLPRLKWPSSEDL